MEVVPLYYSTESSLDSRPLEKVGLVYLVYACAK